MSAIQIIPRPQSRHDKRTRPGVCIPEGWLLGRHGKTLVALFVAGWLQWIRIAKIIRDGDDLDAAFKKRQKPRLLATFDLYCETVPPTAHET